MLNYPVTSQLDMHVLFAFSARCHRTYSLRKLGALWDCLVLSNPETSGALALQLVWDFGTGKYRTIHHCFSSLLQESVPCELRRKPSDQKSNASDLPLEKWEPQIIDVSLREGSRFSGLRLARSARCRSNYHFPDSRPRGEMHLR